MKEFKRIITRIIFKLAAKVKFKIKGVYTMTCFDRNGNEKWTAVAENLVPNDALDNILDVFFGNSTQTAAWFIGLKNVGTVAAGDTLASHVGWTENSNYTGDRKAYTIVAASSQSITNTASKASFAISVDTQTIAGGFLASVATTTTGILASAADFTGGNKAADNGDTIEVQYDVSIAAA